MGRDAKIQESYAGTGKEPKIEVSDNAFKIVLPNLNLCTQQKDLNMENTTESLRENVVINLAKELGTLHEKIWKSD